MKPKLLAVTFSASITFQHYASTGVLQALRRLLNMHPCHLSPLLGMEECAMQGMVLSMQIFGGGWHCYVGSSGREGGRTGEMGRGISE